MATASLQSFGNLLASGIQGFAGGFNKDWNTAFKTPLDSTQTLPVKPEATSGLAGSLSSFMTPEFDAIQKIENKDMRNYAMMEYLADRRAQRDVDNLPNAIKTIRDQQYADRVRARPLELEELKEKQKLELQAKIAGGFLDMVTGFPAKLTAHRDMVAPMNELMRRTRREGINYGAVPVQRIF